MLGDFLVSRWIFVPPDANDVRLGIVNDGDEAFRVLIPQVARGAFKISDNESPRPQDRVFAFYNYFQVKALAGITQTIDIHREVIGFEKTFLDGDASVGIRLPFFQVNAPAIPGAVPGFGIKATADAITQSDVGDLTIVTKYAFINDRATGNVLSGGLVVTAPTGPGETLAIPTPPTENGPPNQTFRLHPTLFQPWVGGIYNAGDFFIHGFSSVVVPTDSRDVTYFFNDLGVGYFVIRRCNSESLLTAVVPTFEVHVNTPLNHRGTQQVPIGAPDVVDLTAGITFGLGERTNLSFGAVTPVTGPRPFDIEAQAFLNFRF